MSKYIEISPLTLSCRFFASQMRARLATCCARLYASGGKSAVRVKLGPAPVSTTALKMYINIFVHPSKKVTFYCSVLRRLIAAASPQVLALGPFSQSTFVAGSSCSFVCTGALTASAPSAPKLAGSLAREGFRYWKNFSWRACLRARRDSGAKSFSLALILEQSDNQCPNLPHPR